MKQVPLEDTMIEPHIGISEKNRNNIAGQLSKLLADTYTLYLKTHNFHWNVTGPMFQELHLLFEKQYQELAEAVDELAERIRALGVMVPASFSEFLKLSRVSDPEMGLDAEEMIQQLLEGHETATRTAREGFGIAEDAQDEATFDILIQRTKVHEKAAWMLRSLLEAGMPQEDRRMAVSEKSLSRKSKSRGQADLGGRIGS